jgi:hypothetical protein
MSKRRPQRPSIATTMVAVVVLAAVVLGLAVPADADAGTYVIDDCPAALTSPDDSGPWVVFGSPQADKGTCSGGLGDWMGPLSGSMSPGELDGVRVSVPGGSGITIREAKVWWAVPHQIQGADTFAIASASGAVVLQANTLDGGYDRRVTPDELVLPSTTTWLELADYCSNDDAGNGCTFGEGENANLQLFGAQLTLSDEDLPTGTVTGGALAGNGPFAGTQSLAFNAADTDTGVRSVQLLVDGNVVAQKDYLAECAYTNFAACPTTRSDTINWDTTSVSDGTHELALQITDAAHNRTILDSHTITIANPNDAPAGAGIGPGSPLALRGPENGTNASDQAKLTARWASTAKATRTSGYGAADRITGRLTAPGGVPISGASLNVYETPAYEGARTVRLAGARTGPAGRWTLTLPRDSSSSALRLEYRSHQNDTIPVASAALTLRVHAGIALRIAPRVASVGRTIFFSGTLHGAPIPPGGKQLVLEARSGTEWLQFDTVSTGAKGRYRATYRFKFPGPIAYQFRVLSRYEADFPFLDGTSNVVGVYER